MNAHNDPITPGDRVRVRYGSHAGEVATVTNVTWHSNRFGSYARVHVCFNGGETDARGMDSLEKVAIDPPPAERVGH